MVCWKTCVLIAGNGVQETLPDDDLPRDVGAAKDGTAISCN